MGLTTYFLLPLIVIEGQGPLEALTNSTDLAGKSWVRQVLGDVSLSLAFILMAIPGILCFLGACPTLPSRIFLASPFESCIGKST